MKNYIAAAVLCAFSTPAFAVDVPPAMTGYAQEQLQLVASNTAIIDAIARQNEKTADLSNDEIIALDNEWRAGVDGGDRTLIDTTLSNPASAFLSGLVESSGGMIAEVFVMDARGLNVGQSGVTSDYWQGDEAKFTETYPLGPDSMHVSEVELDESTNAYQAQVSITISDPDTNTPIGAVTFGIDATPFF